MKRDEKKAWMDFSVTGRNKEKARVMASPFRKKPGKDESRDYEEYRLSLNGSWDFMLAEGDELPDIEKFFVSQNIIDEVRRKNPARYFEVGQDYGSGRMAASGLGKAADLSCPQLSGGRGY